MNRLFRQRLSFCSLEFANICGLLQIEKLWLFISESEKRAQPSSMLRTVDYNKNWDKHKCSLCWLIDKKKQQQETHWNIRCGFEIEIHYCLTIKTHKNTRICSTAIFQNTPTHPHILWGGIVLFKKLHFSLCGNWNCGVVNNGHLDSSMLWKEECCLKWKIRLSIAWNF